MLIVLKHDVYRVKNGFASRSPELGLTAHGYSPELAKQNLERTALLFFRPFHRGGTLEEEVKLLGVAVEQNGADLEIAVAD